MSRVDEEWVKSALTNDTMVVQLLVQLQNTSPFLKPAAVAPLDWSVRQRRSKSVSVNKNQKKSAHQSSPTTPLSWCCPTSVSGGSGGTGDGGFEESSEPPSFKISNTTRSKVYGNNENTSSKRSRKKKTFAQLKEEENFLIKERRNLNKEIAALQMNLEKQTLKNKSLKRLKIESQTHLDRRAGYSSSHEESVSGYPRPSMMHSIASDNDVTLQPSTLNGCLKQNGDTEPKPCKFVLPDLNIPFEDSSSDVICGVS